MPAEVADLADARIANPRAVCAIDAAQAIEIARHPNILNTRWNRNADDHDDVFVFVLTNIPGQQ